MPMRARRMLLAVVLLLICSVPARADLTIFAGLQGSPVIRPSTGISLGFGVLLVGWEVEIARVTEEVEDAAPSISAGTASVYVQNPVPISGVQLYAIAGAGLYRERLGAFEQTDGHLALGGGAKISLAGPLKLRLDYRYFRLRDARSPDAQRLYAGLTLAF
jgi:opacity protein-like surface antigen